MYLVCMNQYQIRLADDLKRKWRRAAKEQGFSSLAAYVVHCVNHCAENLRFKVEASNKKGLNNEAK